MKLTIAFITGRAQSMVRWVIESLQRQVKPGDKIDFIIVDALKHTYRKVMTYDPAVHHELDQSVATFSGFSMEHFGEELDTPWLTRVRVVEPKPTPWQGRYRVTKDNWWAMSNARNTALLYCETEWIAFLDDRCVLWPAWLESVREAMAGVFMGKRFEVDGRVEGSPYVLCGRYEKRHGMTKDGKAGKLVATDNRFDAAPTGLADCGGQWLYGCSFALPLEWALHVNGFEEGCDGLSAEDYIFGMNLANAGYPLCYSPQMMVIQDRSPGTENTYYRKDKGKSPNDKSHAALARFGVRERTEFTPDLRVLRAVIAAGGTLPQPPPDLRDWFDGEIISDFEPER